MTLRKILAEQFEGPPRDYTPRPDPEPEPPSPEALAFDAIRAFAPPELLRDDARRNQVFREQLALVKRWRTCW
jgi:hypothetical protein